VKILLTGSSGFLGKYICDHVKLKNYEITTVGRTNSNLICDLSKSIPVIDVRYINLVIHSAGKAHSVPQTETEIQEFYEVNVNGTENLLKGLEYAGVPQQFVFISSVSVYGLEHGQLIKENSPLLARDPYGLSKIAAEQLILDWCGQNHVVCTVLRLPLLVGVNAPGNLGAMVKAITKGYYFNIGGGVARKSMILAQDVARFIPLVAPIGGIYNLTDGFHPNFNELSTYIAINTNKKTPFNLPLSLAKVLGYLGDLLGNRSPLNSSKVNKIISTLTFDDSKARAITNWQTQSVLDYIKDNRLE
jgi:nucleoside-diphosphate-sugar epimerase